MRILYITRWFPYPPDNGVKMRLYHLIKALAEFHTVDLISFCASSQESLHSRPLGDLCRRIEVVKYRPFNPNRLKALAGFFADKPRMLIDTFQPEMADKVSRAIASEPYDLVIASEIDMAPYAESVQGIALLFEGPEFSSYLDDLNPSRITLPALRKQATWWKLSGYLKKLSRVFDGWAVVSEQERRNLMRVSPALGRIRVIPNGADLERKPSPPAIPQSNRLIYAGSLTYQANFDAVYYFLNDIFPLIQKKHPAARFYVTGSHENVDISRLPYSPNVVLTGHVPDIAAAVAESWVSVVPLRKGSGTRLKILESLSLGTPVVSTSKGCEGLELIPGSHILIGDDPASFAAQVNRILDSADLRTQLSQQGRLLVQNKYDWTAIGTAFREFAEEVSFQHPIAGKNASSNRLQPGFFKQNPE